MTPDEIANIYNNLQRVTTALDAHNRQWRQTLNDHSPAFEKARLISSQPCQLFTLFGPNANTTTDCYILVFDSAVARATGDADFAFCLTAPFKDNFYIDVNDRPWKFSRGIYVAASSSQTSLQPISANDVFFAWQILNEVPA